ncbi:MAG TPA: ATP cone domain-containing protein [Solirubrobacterales bacterium]
MECPSCNAATRVAETRSADRGSVVRRRRHCPSCGERFTTFERIERGPLTVRKRDGQAQRFDRVKLRAALLGAAHKRPAVTAPDVERIVERIEAAAHAGGGEIRAERIVELCLLGLRELDPGAYLQYAGTLPDFNPEITGSFPPLSVRPARDPAQLPAEPTVKGERDD